MAFTDYETEQLRRALLKETFAVLEDIHAELYGVADQVLETLVYGACRELFE